MTVKYKIDDAGTATHTGTNDAGIIPTPPRPIPR